MSTCTEQKPETDDLMAKVTAMMVATVDGSDENIDGVIGDVLRLLRDRMRMDVVFVSEFVDGQRVMRHLDKSSGAISLANGDSAPLEESWCQRVVDGRLPQFIADASKEPAAAELLPALPFPIGTHISTPIVLSTGDVYGTLCCFSLQPDSTATANDLARLRLTAQLAAHKLEHYSGVVPRAANQAPGPFVREASPEHAIGA